jgi:hypothetical protein
VALVVVFNEGGSPQNVERIISSAHTPAWEGRSDALINPDTSHLIGVPRRYWKVQGDELREMTTPEKADVDQASADEADLDVRQVAVDEHTGFDGRALFLRAFADIIKDEINILRAAHGLPDRTLPQLRAAINSRVQSGLVD